MGDVCARGLHVRAQWPLMTMQSAEHVNTAVRGTCLCICTLLLGMLRIYVTAHVRM